MKKNFWLLLLLPALASASGGGGFPTFPMLGEHCTVIVNNTALDTTTVPNNAFTKAIMTNVLYDQDGMADTTFSRIKVPGWARHVQVIGHATFPPQQNGTGFASVHLFRNASSTNEAHYHVRYYYPWSNPADVNPWLSMVAVSPVIPATPNDTWQLDVWQDSGASVTLVGATVEQWLEACFYR